jgi:hypothetical protein
MKKRITKIFLRPEDTDLPHGKSYARYNRQSLQRLFSKVRVDRLSHVGDLSKDEK